MIRIKIDWDFVSPVLKVISGIVNVKQIFYNKKSEFIYKCKVKREVNTVTYTSIIVNKDISDEANTEIQRRVNLMVDSFFNGVILRNYCYHWLSTEESEKILTEREMKMSKKVIECSQCGEQATYDSDNPEEIAKQTGFEMTAANIWLCPTCLKDNYETEGC